MCCRTIYLPEVEHTIQCRSSSKCPTLAHSIQTVCCCRWVSRQNSAYEFLWRFLCIPFEKEIIVLVSKIWNNLSVRNYLRVEFQLGIFHWKLDLKLLIECFQRRRIHQVLPHYNVHFLWFTDWSVAKNDCWMRMENRKLPSPCIRTLCPPYFCKRCQWADPAVLSSEMDRRYADLKTVWRWTPQQI